MQLKSNKSKKVNAYFSHYQAKEHRRKSNKKRRDSGRNKEKEKAPKRVGVSFFTTLDKPVADIRPLAEELHGLLDERLKY